METSALSGSMPSAMVMQLGMYSTRSSALTVTTAEGDTVTLTTESTRALGVAAASGTSSDGSVDAAAFEGRRSDSVKLVVQGDLSREELVDLQKVIKAFQHAARRGNAEQFLKRLSRSDLDTIATVSGSVKVESGMNAAYVAQA
jgi:hypothetical protein